MARSPDQAKNINENGAGGGGRTHTERKLHGILSPVRLEGVVKHWLPTDPHEPWQGVGDIGLQVKGIIESGSKRTLAGSTTDATGRRRNSSASFAP